MRLLRLARPGTDEVVNAVTRIHQSAVAALASPVSVVRPRVEESVVHRADAEASGTFLGLRFDVSPHRITRHGWTSSVVFHHRLTPFQLARTLADRGDQLTDWRWLRQHWSNIGNAERPTRSTIYCAISDLGAELRSLGIGIQNSPNLGWRLVDSEQENAV
jgi:hypothetical protein